MATDYMGIGGALICKGIGDAADETRSADNGWAVSPMGLWNTVSKNYSDYTLAQLYNASKESNVKMGFIDWRSSICPGSSTAFVVLFDWCVLAFTTKGQYYLDGDTLKWIKT